MNESPIHTNKTMLAFVAVAGSVATMLQIPSGTVPGRPVEIILYASAYIIALTLVTSMVVLEYHIDRPYPAVLLAPLGFMGVVFFLLSYGLQHFNEPYPGALIGIALALMLFGSGIFVGWLVWGISDDALIELGGTTRANLREKV